MKVVVELNRLLLKFAMLDLVDIQDSSREDSVKFNFLRIIWYNKSSWRVFENGLFRETKIQSPPWCNPWDILDLIQSSHSELLGGWNV